MIKNACSNVSDFVSDFLTFSHWQVGCYELYQHTGDTGMAPAAFDDYENVNLAKDPVHKAKLEEMLTQLHVEVERWWTPNPPDESSL